MQVAPKKKSSSLVISIPTTTYSCDVALCKSGQKEPIKHARMVQRSVCNTPRMPSVLRARAGEGQGKEKTAEMHRRREETADRFGKWWDTRSCTSLQTHMPTYSTGHVIMRPAYMQTDVLVVGPLQSTAHRAIDLFLSYPEVGQHVTVLAH